MIEYARVKRGVIVAIEALAWTDLYTDQHHPLDDALETLLDRGRSAGALREDVDATDVIPLLGALSRIPPRAWDARAPLIAPSSSTAFASAERDPAAAQVGRRASTMSTASPRRMRYAARSSTSFFGSLRALIRVRPIWAAWARPISRRRARRTNRANSSGADRTQGPTRAGLFSMGEALDQLAAAAGPAGRPGQPEEIADAIVLLASDTAGFVHGAVLPVDGGRIAV